MELSSEITGFEIFDIVSTELGVIYFEFLCTYEPDFKKILYLWVQNKLLVKKYNSLIEKIVFLWYTGSWKYNDGSNYILSTQSYNNCLMWKAANIHPIGGKPEGFGAWQFNVI